MLFEYFEAIRTGMGWDAGSVLHLVKDKVVRFEISQHSSNITNIYLLTGEIVYAFEKYENLIVRFQNE